MADEIGGINSGEIWGEIRQDANKVTEEAVRRVQNDQKKAKQAQQAIQQDKATNDKFAKFLTYIIQHLHNEQLIKALYEVFFKTKHPKTQLTYLRKNINTIVIIGMFAPFYPEEVKIYELEEFFGELLSELKTISTKNYIHYLKKISKTYHDNIPIDKKDFVKFIGEILIEFAVVSNPPTNHEEKEEFFASLEQEIYGK